MPDVIQMNPGVVHKEWDSEDRCNCVTIDMVSAENDCNTFKRQVV